MKLTPFYVDLKNGKPVLVREVGPSDRILLQTGFEHLSEESRYFRFLMARKKLTDTELDGLTASNEMNHVAVGALFEGAAGPEAAGIARYICLSDDNQTAEIAVTISDRFQRQGLGSLLLGALSKIAWLNGISEFVALVHSQNRSMLGLFDQLDSTRTSVGGVEVEIKFPVFPDSVKYPATSTGNAFRKVDRLALIA